MWPQLEIVFGTRKGQVVIPISLKWVLFVIGSWVVLHYLWWQKYFECGILVVASILGYTTFEILDRRSSLLPKAKVEYYPNVVTADLVTATMTEILTYPLEKDRVLTEAKLGSETVSGSYKLSRATLVFGDDELAEKSPPGIWGMNKSILPWPKTIRTIKREVETITGTKYNVCLANYYKTGKEAIHWHADREELGDAHSIASVSLGAERMFSFREKEKRNVTVLSIPLENGSLIHMGKNCQNIYEHCLEKDLNCTEPRLNLTFRKFHY